MKSDWFFLTFNQVKLHVAKIFACLVTIHCFISALAGLAAHQCGTK